MVTLKKRRHCNLHPSVRRARVSVATGAFIHARHSHHIIMSTRTQVLFALFFFFRAAPSLMRRCKTKFALKFSDDICITPHAARVILFFYYLTKISAKLILSHLCKQYVFFETRMLIVRLDFCVACANTK